MKREATIRAWAIRETLQNGVRYTIMTGLNRWDCQVEAERMRIPGVDLDVVRVELYDPAPSRRGIIMRRSR